jgi:hypothetical protein
MENKILVLYVGVAGIRTEDIDTHVRKIATKILPSTFEGEMIVIPAQSPNTWIECINPQFIPEPELIEQHREMMKKLHEALQNQLEQLKQENKNG